jgi:hypothetical protein
MVEFVSSNNGEFSSEFVQNKTVSSIAVIVVENNRMTKMLAIRLEVRN